MNPREYLSGLKARSPRRHIGVSDLPDSVLQFGAKAGRTVEDIVQEANQADLAEYIVSLLSPQLPGTLRELFESGWIVAGEVNDPAPDLYVDKIGDEGYAIVLHSGLRNFIYRVARIVATRFRPMGEADRSAAELIGIEETARLVAEVFWWFQETGQSAGPFYSIEDEQIQLANLLALEAEKFLLAHEVGHILDLESNHQNPAFLKLDSGIDSQEREEHAADLFGAYLAMELHDSAADRDPFQTGLAYAGVEFALQIYQGLELLGFDFRDSHPPASKRLDVIRADLRDRCKSPETWLQVSVLARGIEHLFASMLRIMQDPAEHQEYFERKAQNIVAELDALLDRCSGGMVPDYAMFNSNAVEIFDRGYSHRLLQRVTEVAAAFAQDVALFERDGTSRGPDLGGHFKTGHSWTGQNRPPLARRPRPSDG